MEHRTAIIIGATGLVGTALVKQLLENDRFDKLKIIGRRSINIRNNKVEEHLVDFDQPQTWKHLVQGDVLFSTLGTTLKQAGSKEKQYKVDYTYQFETAKAAAENHVPVYVLVSAAMSDPDARIFYSRIKGELERDIKQLSFRHIHILQPGILSGNRKEQRTGEKMSISIIRFLNRLGIARKQKPIDVAIVAKAMIQAGFKNESLKTYTLLEVFDLANGS
ncbi:MAG: NAD(P)H-binding protein [Flavisolibacter sp.]